MDKQKQIEEAKRLLDKYFKLYGYIQPPEVLELVANDLYENNVCKIPENAVVLTREEYDALKTIEKYHIKSCGKNSVVLTEEEWANSITIDEFIEKVKKTVKETAEKFANMVKAHKHLHLIPTGLDQPAKKVWRINITADEIDEIAKELTGVKK